MFRYILRHDRRCPMPVRRQRHDSRRCCPALGHSILHRGRINLLGCHPACFEPAAAIEARPTRHPIQGRPGSHPPPKPSTMKPLLFFPDGRARAPHNTGRRSLPPPHKNLAPSGPRHSGGSTAAWRATCRNAPVRAYRRATTMARSSPIKSKPASRLLPIAAGFCSAATR